MLYIFTKQAIVVQMMQSLLVGIGIQRMNPMGNGGAPFHSGDIGNINVGSDGVGRLELTAKDRWSIGGSPETNILGKAIIVHAGEDDFTSQPSGAAGKRVGCGVIALE